MDSTSKKTHRQAGSFGNVLKLVMGTLFAQGLTIIVMPILTRIYGPDAFGTAALFTAIVTVISGISCLCYERSILLPKSDQEASNLLGLSFLILVGMSFGSFLIILSGKEFICRWLKSPGLKPYLWLIPVAIFFNGLFLALNYWNTRTKHFGRLSISRIASAVTAAGVKLGMGFTGYNTTGSLIGGDVLGAVASNLNLSVRIWHEDKNLLRSGINLKTMIAGLRRHKKFPIFLTWSTLISVLSVQLPVFFLATYFSPSIVGQYALGLRLLQMPMILVGEAVRQVFSQKAAVANLEGTLSGLVKNTFRRIFLLGIFPTLLLGLIGKEIFLVFFGSSWVEAGVYSQILSFWMFLSFIVTPINSLSSILERQELSVLFNAVFLISRAASLIVGGLMKNIYIALILYSSSGVIILGAICWWYMSLANVSISKMFAGIYKDLWVAFLFGGVAWGVKHYFPQQPGAVIIVGCVLLLMYFAFFLHKEIALRKEILEYWRKVWRSNDTHFFA